MKSKRIWIYTIAAFFLCWCVIVFKSDISQIKLAPVKAAWDAVFFAGLLSLANYLLRIIRWFAYLTRLGHIVEFRYSALTYLSGFAFTLSPGKVGELVRGRYLQNTGIPLSSTAGAFFVERLLDVLAMICLGALVATDYDAPVWTAIIVATGVLVTLALSPWEHISEWLRRTEWFPDRLNQFLQSMLRALLSAKKLLKPGMLVAGFAISLLAWGCEGFGVMVLGKLSEAASIDAASAIGIYSVAVVVGALSFLPGGLGSTEAVMAALLNSHGYPLPDALLITLVCRLLTLWFAVAIGWLAVYALRSKPTVSAVYDSASSSSSTPLCVDLDGTLILSDSLIESVLVLLKRNPLTVALFPIWLLRGKAALKAEIAKRVTLNPLALPYNGIFLDWLYAQKDAGRELWLCTAANYRLAQGIADHLQIFSGVIASTDELNLPGRAKAQQLIEKFGEKSFEYCGNAWVDLAIWKVSRRAIAVNCNQRLIAHLQNIAKIHAVFPKPGNFLPLTLKALRPHQWLKNLLVFVPLAAAHKLNEASGIEHASIAFLAFGLCASSVYLLNDMLDLEADRQHPHKCKRPFASGRLPLTVGLVLIPLLLLAAGWLAMALPVLFGITLTGYYATTIAYSFLLKRIVLVDTITLAGLYTVRIIAGAVATNISLSFWLLLFSIFLFFSLALVKRYAELDSALRQGKLKAAGRGYHVEDLPILHSLGTASGKLCVLVLALYINSPEIGSHYRHPQAVWLLCVLLLYWVSRIWLLTHRGQMHDDPVLFAVKDATSLSIAAFAAITIYLAV